MKIENSSKRGFTLIELLVVIAIIGILSSVVLAALSSARKRGEDAKIKSTFKTLITMGNLYLDYSGTGNYNGLCSFNGTVSGFVVNFNNALQTINAVGGCQAAGQNWRVRVVLKDEDKLAPSGPDWICTDRTGTIKYFGADPGNVSSDC